MNIFDRVTSEFEGCIVEKGFMFGGTWIKLKFENGYGASFIKHRYSYGNEIGVLSFDGDKDMGLTYDTDITSDVLGHLTDDEVIQALNDIKGLDESGRLVTK